MSDWPYSDEELQQYFDKTGSQKSDKSGRRSISRYWRRKFDDERKAKAATLISYLVVSLLAITTLLGGYFVSLIDELPPLNEIENPHYQLATIAYTADGKELARYARQNRSWVTFENISPHMINALWATEDHRFYDHWGMDVFRTFSAVGQTVLAKLHIPGFFTQGGSTISQQLARNLYDSRIGFEQTIGRKMKEWVTAVQLERRYTKNEIIEMYLNTIAYGSNTFGIEAAARTFFSKDPFDLNELESATLVGLLKGTTRYNPRRNPERARRRRNVVLALMVKRDLLDAQFFEDHRADSVKIKFRSAAITQSLAPHFAEQVRKELDKMFRGTGIDIYDDGLTVYTTLDSRMQAMAQAAVDSLMPCLDAVAGFEWSESGTDERVWSQIPCAHLNIADHPGIPDDYEEWSQFWRMQPTILRNSIRNTERYRRPVRRGEDGEALLLSLLDDEAFIDSLKAEKTRLETGFVALDPQTGFVKAWIGGRKLDNEWYDHVSRAQRQPGSTFKPFVYLAAIDNGWSQYSLYLDDSLHYVDDLGIEWNPGNSGSDMTGDYLTLRRGLSKSINTITARLILDVGPAAVGFYARRVGIKSSLNEVPALALGTSDVNLLEMTTAYSTFANGGLLYEPTLIWRVEDGSGNVLFEADQAPKEALSERTAYTMVDMLREVIQSGTGIRMNSLFGMRAYDLAGKTGTTQYSADNWFMLMHPDLVMGSWVGFNDPRFRFRTSEWGQGARAPLFIVGEFFRSATQEDETFVSKEARFPSPERFGAYSNLDPTLVDSLESLKLNSRSGRIDW